MRATRRRFACAAGLIAALVEVAAAQVLAQGVAPDAPGNLASVPEATLFVGGVTTSVPLEVPQGRNGIMPHLALAYTGGGPSLYGHGWDLPIGTIQRRLKYGVPTCEQASERYQYVLNLPGRTLEFKLNGTIGTPNVFEVPYKIVAKPSPAPWIWEVTDPSSGIRYVFGEGTARTGANLQSTDVNSCGENTIFSWALSSVIDPNGNKMSIIYVAGKSVHQPLRIEYGQGTGVNPLFYVDFNWQPRPMGEQIISAAAGFESVLADRLWKVVIGRIGGTFVRRYDFAYEDDYSENRFDRRTFLRSVIQYGRNASGSAVALARSDFQPAASTFQYANIPADPTRFGIADVQEPSVIPNLPGGIQLEITASVAATGESWSVRDLIDINGDGYLDIVDTFHLNNGQPGSTNSCTEWRVWRGNRDGFEADSVEWNVSNLPPVRRCYLNHVAIIHDNIQATEWGIADVTGDGLPDFIDASGEEWVIRTLPRTGDTTTRYFHAGSPYLRKIRYGVSNVEAPGLGLTAANGEGVSRDLIDMNGDGRLDFVDVRDETLGDGFKWNVWLNFDEGVKAAVPFKAHFKFISVVIAGTRLLSTLDVNGDGIPDQTYWKADGASGGWQVHLRTGRTTWRDVYWPANGLIDSRKLSSFNGARVAERIIQDVNGDGLPDIIDKGRCRVVANLGTGPVTAALNNGAGFTIVPWRFPASARCELGYSNLSADKMLSITDVDHDGLVDLLRKDAGSITVTRNAGGAWCAGGDCALPPERRTASAPYALLRSISALGSTTTLEYRPLSQWTNGSSRVPLSLWTVTRITTDDGLCERDIDGSILSCLTEGAHEIDRQYSYEGAFFSRSDREFRGFSKVTTHDTPSPAGQQFSVTYFHQGRHLKGRVASTDSYVATASGPALKSHVRYDWECANVASGVSYSACGDASEPVWVRRVRVKRVAHEGGSQAYSEERVEEWNRCSNLLFSGYPARVSIGGITSANVPDGRRVATTTDYECMDSAGLYYIKPRSTVIRGTGVEISASSAVEYTYENGNITAIHRWVDSPSALAEGYQDCPADIKTAVGAAAKCTLNSYGYDSTGLPITATDALGRVSKISYDSATHLYPEVVTSPLHQKIQSTFDPRCGVPLTRTVTYDEGVDPATLARYQWGYDQFCRRTKYVLPGQTLANPQVQYSYVIGQPGAVPMHVRSRSRLVRSSGVSLVSAATALDALGRVTHQAAQRVVDGTLRWVGTEQQYDTHGLPARTSVPYFLDDEPSLWTSFTAPTGTAYSVVERDALGRTTKVTNPDETFSTISYPAPRQVETDDECFSPGSGCTGARVRKFFDAFGQVTEKQLFKGNAATIYSLTTYDYDGLGRLHQTIQGDASGLYSNTAVAIAYDSLGRKISMRDPDSGDWHYGYDAAGNLIYEDDPKPDQFLRLCYDAARRRTKKFVVAGSTAALTSPASMPSCFSSQSGEVSYFYDRDPLAQAAIPNGLGRLVRVEEPAVTTRVGGYDLLGNPLSVSKGIAIGAVKKWAAFRYHYDDTGRLDRITYPDGEVAILDFDASGAPRSVVSANRTYVNDVRYDAFGRMTVLAHGNGVADSRSYSAAASDQFRLSHLRVQRGSDIPYLNELFDSDAYDATGRLLTIENDPASGPATAASYEYDPLGRLTKATLGTPGAVEQVLTYEHDVLGNLFKKTSQTWPAGVSQISTLEMSFDPLKPHTITGTKVNGGTAVAAQHDLNGNREARMGDSYDYDAEDRLIAASGSGGTAQFQYDYTGTRVSTTDDEGSTRYFNQLAHYRETAGGAGTLTKHYFVGGARVASLSFPYQAPTTMASLPLEKPTIMLAGLGDGRFGLVLFLSTDLARTLGLIACVGGLLLFAFPSRARWRGAGLRLARTDAVLILIVWMVQCLPLPLLIRPAHAAGAGGEMAYTPTRTSTPTRTPAPQATVPGTVLIHYHNDRLGSPHVITGPSGQVLQQIRYEPYGKVRSPAGGSMSRFEFTGYEAEKSANLQYAQARFYDPEFGTFLTHDPLREFPSPYTYVGWDPVNSTDPSGTHAEHCDIGLEYNGKPVGYLCPTRPNPRGLGDYIPLSANDPRLNTFDYWNHRPPPPPPPPDPDPIDPGPEPGPGPVSPMEPPMPERPPSFSSTLYDFALVSGASVALGFFGADVLLDIYAVATASSGWDAGLAVVGIFTPIVTGGQLRAAGRILQAMGGGQPKRIYSARELIRRAEDSGPFHNFPESFDQAIFERGTRTVEPDFFNVPRTGLSNDSVMYQLSGSVNGNRGTYEIAVRPSASGNTELIVHRFFRPEQ